MRFRRRNPHWRQEKKLRMLHDMAKKHARTSAFSQEQLYDYLVGLETVVPPEKLEATLASSIKYALTFNGPLPDWRLLRRAHQVDAAVREEA